MYYLRVILIFLLGISGIQAQQNIIFEENFDNNFLQWMHGESAEYSANVKGGHYNIEYKQDAGIWYFWQSIPVHPDTSFYIESKIIPYLKTKQSVYGIIWGVRNTGNYNAFLVSNMGKTSVVTCRKGQFSRIIDWTPTGNYQNNQAHTLGIRYEEGKMHYFLDGKKAFSTDPLPFYGDLLGFVISGKTTAHVDHLIIKQDREINLVEDPIKGVKRVNLGKNINSPYAELHPVIAHDGQSIYITRKGHPENLGVDKRDDAWVAKKQADGSWAAIKNIGTPINNNNHNQVISVSPDNNTLLIGNTYNANGTSKGKGVSISHRKEDGTWEIPNDVIIDNFYNQNPIHSIHLAANKQLLLMSIERNDSYGHLDLYVSFLQKNGRFSQPKNLGNTINTSYEDGTPFLAGDGKTLYFSSSGHGGYGSTDVFMAKRLDDTWRNWTTPKNLGPEINTNSWEGYYSITASGSKAYLVSTKGKNHIGGEDIYEVIPPASSRPDPVLLVKGKVFDAKTLDPIRAKILYYDFKDNEEIGDALSNSSDGSYQVILPPENQYKFLSFKGGYYPVSERIEIGKIDEYTEKYINLYLHPIEVGEQIPLNNISFLKETNELTSTSDTELDRLVVFLEKYPNMEIKVNSASIKKVQNIKKYLVSKGIDEKRIKSNIASNDKSNHFTIVSINPEDDKIIVDRRGNFEPKLNSKKLRKGQIFRLNNTYFAADSSYITRQAERELLQLKDFLKSNPSIVIEIGGHTNGLPEHDYCDNLSAGRAKNVAKYLEQRGIPAYQLHYKGYGKRQPIATNETLRGRQQNQRVEIKILDTNAQYTKPIGAIIKE